jgi:polysaccharide export outer membrane protein
MKNYTSLNCGLLFPNRILCALAMVVLLGFSGCASHNNDQSAAGKSVPSAAPDTTAANATNAPDTTATNAPDVADNQPHKELIVLREGDTVRISFPGNANLDTAQQIRRDGRITMPLVGEVDASGLTPDQLKDKMIKLYESQIASKEVTVTVVSSSFPVFVTGAVVHPGKILSDHPITALEAIMEAGGFDYNTANLKAVKVLRQGTNTTEHFTLNLKAVMKGTDTRQFYLKPSDMIYVPQRFSFF